MSFTVGFDLPGDTSGGFSIKEGGGAPLEFQKQSLHES